MVFMKGFKRIKYKSKSLIFILITILVAIFIVLISQSFIKYYAAIKASEGIWNSKEEQEEKKHIKWVDCNLTLEVLDKTSKLDINSHVNNEDIKYSWIELISYLACKNGNNFKNFKQKDLDNLIIKLKEGKTIEELTKDFKYYSYYFESYSAILGEFIGEYEIESSDKTAEEVFEKRYGLKVFLPIAKNYGFSHYDDFGNSRSYGFKRVHLGNDLMGSIGTPIIAVESGIIEACGWNQYGGWRIGIRSFDGKRYYYYAHLRKNQPFIEDMYEGKIVKAGDVIGYLGMTGYSTKENVNNINVPHLHFGMQLIFDEVQKEGVNQIWIDVYNIIEFLKRNKTEVYKEDKDSKDYQRKYDFIEKNLYE